VYTQPDTSGALFADNGMKLGIFGLNVSAAGGLSKGPDRHEPSWTQNLDLVRQAEAAGFEVAVPISRWRGFEGETNPWGRSLETFTWASALAASTSSITLWATSHVLATPPLLAAKQIATIDEISGGRIGLNTVAGWHDKELRMFGATKLNHDQRYDYVEEWVDIVVRLWAGDDVTYHGKHLSMEEGYLQPKPVQSPRPLLMNAAFSPRGQQAAVQFADIVYVSAFTAEQAAEQVARVRSLAAEAGREDIKVWMATSCALADTDAEAMAMIERWGTTDADVPAVQNAIEWTMGSQMDDAARAAMIPALASTMAGYPLIGSAETVVAEIGRLAEAGVDGICHTFMNYEVGVPRFIEEVLPLMERDGIRAPRGARRVAQGV
jgi:dimethylsulfone monooxygenase